ncbi:MAG: hypothetical protein ACFE85_10895 [Candidatus Hodarchaeota archaeon]
MGIKLQNLVERKKIEFSKLAGKIIAVDAPNIVMGLFNFARKDAEGKNTGLLLDDTQRPIAHLFGLLYRINFFYSKKIFPLFVFDGVDSELKRFITKNRLHDFRLTQSWYQQAISNGNTKLARQIALSREYMWQNVIHESKQLLGALGVPYIESPASAESQCAQFVKDKVAHYSNSQDFDSLLFGCPSLLQNLTKSLRRKIQGQWKYQKIEPLEIQLKHNLDQLGINQFQLVDMAILIGTDYFPGIRGIGPKTALKLILRHHTIEKVQYQEKNRYNFEKLTPELIKQVRKIFLLPEVIQNYGEISWSYPNEAQVHYLLFEEHNLDRKRIKNNMGKFLDNYEQCRNYFIFHKDKPSLSQKTLFSF